MNPKARKIAVVIAVSLLFSSQGCVLLKKPQRPKRLDAAHRPERIASNALIRQGEMALDQGQFDRATDHFQEAVNVDSTNGIGFYYLALVKYRTGEYGAVWNFIEKAEALLAKDPVWRDKISALKEEVGQAHLP